MKITLEVLLAPQIHPSLSRAAQLRLIVEFLRPQLSQLKHSRQVPAPSVKEPQWKTPSKHLLLPCFTILAAATSYSPS